MATDYWAHFYHDNPKALTDDTDEDFDLEEIRKKVEDGDWEDV